MARSMPSCRRRSRTARTITTPSPAMPMMSPEREVALHELEEAELGGDALVDERPERSALSTPWSMKWALSCAATTVGEVPGSTST